MGAADSEQRKALDAVLVRFTPHLQPLTESAFDHIVQNLLFEADNPGQQMVERTLQRRYSNLSGGLSIPPSQLASSLQRLVERGKVREQRSGKRTLYSHTPEGHREVAAAFAELDGKLDRAASRLFGIDKKAAYKKAFRECLSAIEIATLVSQEHDFVDFGALRDGLQRFFSEQHPDSHFLQWQMAQSFYVTKLVGLDASAATLTRTLSERGVFYIDTNVILDAFDPNRPYHRAVKALMKISEPLDIDWVVTQITLGEVQTQIERYAQDILDAQGQIPPELQDKVIARLPRSLRTKVLNGGTLSVDDLFGTVGPRGDLLRERLRLSLDDNAWLRENEDTKEILSFARDLQMKYSRQGRRKNFDAARHDALMLQWVRRARVDSERSVWFLTGDHSLPGPYQRHGCDRSLAVTLDAVMHWLAPLGDPDTGEGEFAPAFAAILQSRLMPPQLIFEEGDFRIFHELHMKASQLPANDVRMILGVVKERGLSWPDDGNQMAYETYKYLSDPGSEHVRRLESLRLELEQVHEDNDKEQQRNREQVQKLEFENRAIQVELERQRTETLKSQGLALALAIWLGMAFIGIVSILLAVEYANGLTIFERVMALGGFSAVIIIPFGTFLTRVTLGTDRLKALGIWGWIIWRPFH